MKKQKINLQMLSLSSFITSFSASEKQTVIGASFLQSNCSAAPPDENSGNPIFCHGVTGPALGCTVAPGGATKPNGIQGGGNCLSVAP